MARRIFFTCTLLFFFVTSSGQQSASFHVQQFGTEEGLPSNGIKGLQWDKHNGFLWIATEAGIVRYNGMSFKTYTNEDDPHITNERILFLVRNNAGTIYTADNPGNIFSVKKNTLSFFGNKKISGNTGSNIASLIVSDLLYNTNHDFTNGPFTVQFGIILPVSDTSCFLSQYGKVYFFSISMKNPVAVPLLEGNLGSAFKTNNEVFLTDQQKNIWRVDKINFSLSKIDLFFEGEKTSSDISKSFILWDNGMEVPIFFNGDKAWKLNYENGRIVAGLICEQIPRESLIRYAQYDEPSQTLFIGTDSKGILIIKKNKLAVMRKERTSPGERTSYYSQVELPDGNILTHDGNILGNKPVSPAGLEGKFNINTLMAGDSIFWFFRPDQTQEVNLLHNYNFKTHRLSVFNKIRQTYSQQVMASTSDGIYMADESRIYKLQGDSLKTLYSYPGNDNLRLHFDMKETEPGVLTIANCNALLRFDTRKNKLDTIYATGSYCVRTIWVYKDYVFFGTYGNGLYISKNGKVKALPPDKNKYLLFTHCFIDDGSGYCWISTNRGLFKASISDMINAYETGSEQVYYHYYGRNDGMDMTEMNGGCMPCGLVKRDKTISFPTMDGLLWVDPDHATPILPAGEIFIDELHVDNKRMDIAALERKSLSANQHIIQVSIGFSAWSNKENIYLQYRLNKSTDWIPVNIDNGAIIQLSNLSKGDHVLEIRKLNGFGINNYSHKEIRFSIPTPWYQRTWFYLLVLLLAGSIIVLYFRYRTGQLKIRQRKLEQQVAEKTKELQEQNEILEKNNTIKTRLISIISHDIVTPLKFVTVAGKNLIEKKAQMSQELQQETLQEMTNTSQELQLLSTNILNWIKYQNENRRMAKETFILHEMVNQVFGILKSLARQKGLSLQNEVPVEMRVYQYYEPLKILVYNLLTNSIQFTEKGSISVTAVQENGFVTVSVKDEGIGMTPEQIQRLMAEEVVITSANVDNKRGHGLGFLIIKDLVKTMEATLSIESKKDEGSTISVKMPATKNGGI